MTHVNWKTKPIPSKELLCTLFSYDMESGIVTRLSHCGIAGRGKIGKPVGWQVGNDDNGRLAVCIARKSYLLSRIIWKMMTDEEPPVVEHENGDHTDNTWLNLRAASQTQNMGNTKIRKDNKTGVKGVTWDTLRKKWMARISINGKSINLGRFDDFEIAKEVREKAALAHFGVDFAFHGHRAGVRRSASATRQAAE